MRDITRDKFDQILGHCGADTGMTLEAFDGWVGENLSMNHELSESPVGEEKQLLAQVLRENRMTAISKLNRMLKQGGNDEHLVYDNNLIWLEMVEEI